MILSKRAVEMLLVLVESRIRYMDVLDLQDIRDLQTLQQCREELEDAIGAGGSGKSLGPSADALRSIH